MADQTAKGDELEKKAEKKLTGWGIFGSKYDDAAELFDKAANSFKLAKNCTPNNRNNAPICFPRILQILLFAIYRLGCNWFLFSLVCLISSSFTFQGIELVKLANCHMKLESKHEAASAYADAANCYKKVSMKGDQLVKLANCHMKLESKHEAASAYADAANCYKKVSMKDAAEALNQAVNLFLEIGRLNMAARYCKEIAELYEQEQDFLKSIEYFEKSADLFDGEGTSTSANQCKQKVAHLAAQLEQYPKAIEIFEEIARQSINNNLLKHSVKGILLNAGICQLCRGDIVAITNSLEKYQELDPTFSGTREFKLLSDLATAIDEGDVVKFTDQIKEYDSMTRLDPWKTTLLLKAKNALKAREEEEDDLT